MSPLAALLQEVAQALTAAATPFALVGGLAVSVRTEPRFTRDIDLAVTVGDDAAAEALVSSLAPRYQPLTMVEHETLGRLAAVRLGRSGGTGGDAVVDLLFASSGIEHEVAADATPLEVFPTVTVPVARTGHLLALKLLARDDRRPQDDVDLRRLLDVATAEDLDLAGRSVRLIAERGADRGRDLERDWRRVLAKRS